MTLVLISVDNTTRPAFGVFRYFAFVHILIMPVIQKMNGKVGMQRVDVKEMITVCDQWLLQAEPKLDSLVQIVETEHLWKPPQSDSVQLWWINDEYGYQRV